MNRLLFSLAMICAGLAIGYSLQLLDRRGAMKLPMEIAAFRKLLQKVGLLFFMPISFAGAVWVVSFSDIRVALLPFIGLFALVTGGILGIGLARLLNSPPKQTGVLFCCGSFTNIGAIGGLVCFMFLGEAGFALVALYKMFEEIAYYTVGFPIAKFYSGADNRNERFLTRILTILKDPFVIAVLSSFMIGLSLNLLGIERPYLFQLATAVSIPAGTFILIVSIGLGMHFSSLAEHMKECLGISIIKFLAVPACACSIAYLFGIHLISDGLVFKVVLILSSMPVAFNSLIAASFYDLDLDLANSCWLLTTGSLIITLPVLYFLT